MQSRAVVLAGGISLIVGAIAFVGVFSYLAASFSYPQILDGAAAEVLPRLRNGGERMRAVWEKSATFTRSFILRFTVLPARIILRSR